MIITLSIISAVLICIFFSGAVLLFGSNTFEQIALPLYFVTIAPLLIIFNKILEEENHRKIHNRQISINLLFICIPLFTAALVLLNPCLFQYSTENEILYCTSYISTLLLAVHISALVFALYLLENMYRYALLYQRRVGWVSFFGLLVLVCHQLFFSTKWLLYGWIPISWIRFTAFLYIPTIIAIPWSFLRYRAGNEKIKVTRDAVYSSFSLLIIGALFTAVGITISALRYFEISISPFDLKVIAMSALFAGTILAGSARMRRRVAKLVNRRLYSNRYDYRFHFFSLHRILGRVEGYEETIEEILEHFRRSLNADHAYLFIVNEQNGNYELFTPKERDLPHTLLIKNDSPIISTLKCKGNYFGLLRIKDNFTMHFETDNPESFSKLCITEIAPVLHYDSLLAILAIRNDRPDTTYDTEDTAMVEVYASFIADFLFKNQILNERLEQKQFESFSHMASFIVHDVKNQVATLKLILKNAEQNISNPNFQKSLIISLQNCSLNLSNLVSKLSMPPRRDRLKVTKTDISPLISKIMDETELFSLAQIKVQKEIEPDLSAEIDENALYYTIKNLIVNALESMKGKNGVLSIRATSLKSSLSLLTSRFSGSEAFFSNYSLVIIVEDTGCGMSDEFLRNRLFRPFSTTKDKGIGIGLYQCKTLIEQMGGKILCDSHLGRGTLFCILL